MIRRSRRLVSRWLVFVASTMYWVTASVPRRLANFDFGCAVVVGGGSALMVLLV